MKIEASAIETELGRILQSHCFRPHKTLKKFLEYVVKQSLKDADANFTQQHIAVEALGKDSDFDPIYNPLIRVQAGRLRKQLEDYYATEGRFNPLRISLPNGSYQPVFTRHQTETSRSPALQEDADPGISQGPSIVCIPRSFAPDDVLSWPFITRLTRDYVTAITQFNYCQVMFSDETPWQQAHWPQDAWRKYGADFALFFDLHTDNTGYKSRTQP